MGEVEDMFEDMADMMADQEDIQEMMGRNFGVDYDESELLDELNELDEEIIERNRIAAKEMEVERKLAEQEKQVRGVLYERIVKSSPPDCWIAGPLE